MAAYAALRSLAQTTHPNTTQNRSFFSSDAEEKVRSIHDYVNFLILFFEEFPDKVNRWEGRIRNLASKIEDIIETLFYHRVQGHPSHVKLEGQLKNEMEKIGLIAGEVMEERPAYLPPSSSSSSRLATTDSDAAIGLDEDIMAIKDQLCGLSSNLQVIPIVGMGGIGKTTLARSIYNDPLIIKHFDFCSWVVVSQDYSPHRFRKILLDLLDSMKLLELQMSGDEIDASEITLKVFKFLKGRRYLIVIDDVWGTQFWDDVRFIFPDDKNGSRIVFTTRQLDVAAYPNSVGHLHEMRFMNDSESWDLLRQKVFTDGHCPPDLEGVGKEIAHKCAGLPLALVLIGGVLSQVNATRVSWEEIAKNVNLVFGRELKEIILLSYTYLPHHLRPCFLFIGGFLEDAKICASRLIRLWVAEGFLKHQNGCSKSLEDEAEEYLEELVKRNLLIVTSRKCNGKIKSCNLHDMVRELCIRKADQEEKFVHVMDTRDLSQGLMNERRISFSHLGAGNVWGQTLRTILCFQIQNDPTWLALLGNYKLLRVLDALGVEQKKLPLEIFELYHLRYLAVMGSFSIPSALSNLVNLQTLIIHLPLGKPLGKLDDVFHSLPLEIWRLPQLRHLFFHAPYTLPHPPKGLNLTLENIQTLLLVQNLVLNKRILQMIPNVKKLGLTYKINQGFHLHHLKDMHQLEKLKVIGYAGFSWRRQNPSFPCTLKKLTLVGGGFPWKDMVVVGSLPNLEILKLVGNACDGETWETTDEEFPRLKVLLIDESHLRQWVTQSKPLPALKSLVLRSCWYLREIPDKVGKTPTLEVIEVYSCTNSLLESAQKIKEDQESYGNYALQIQAGREEIQSVYKPMDASPSRPATSGNNAVIGLDKDLMAIKERLCGRRSSQLQIVPIVGMGGIGKTTLARTVYNDPLIIGHFEIRAWLTLSSDYSSVSMGKFLLSIVPQRKSLYKRKYEEKNDKFTILQRIRRNLRGKRYLVVMDDVWGTQVWDHYKEMFPNDGNGSRIMLTTRVADVSFYAYSGIYLHRMQFMDVYQCWDLLKQTVFGNKTCPLDLEEVGKEIARKCAGLPLAVVLIAGILSAVDETQASWNEIAYNIDRGDGWVIDEILSLSYTQLPHHLRPCFLSIKGFLEDVNTGASRFFKGFQEDLSICASSLISSWIARGFVTYQDECRCSKSLEDEADSRFFEGFQEESSWIAGDFVQHEDGCSKSLEEGAASRFFEGFLEDLSSCASRPISSWIAGDFVQHQDGCSKSLEGKAEEYLEDLVKRNLVSVSSRKSDGKIERCSLHDMVRDFCTVKAQEEKAIHDKALEEMIRLPTDGPDFSQLTRSDEMSDKESLPRESSPC